MSESKNDRASNETWISRGLEEIVLRGVERGDDEEEKRLGRKRRIFRCGKSTVTGLAMIIVPNLSWFSVYSCALLWIFRQHHCSSRSLP